MEKSNMWSNDYGGLNWSKQPRGHVDPLTAFNDGGPFMIKNTTEPLIYEIVTCNRVIASGKKLLETEVHIEWKIDSIILNNLGYVFDIYTTKNDVVKSSAVYNEAIDFSRKIYAATNHLIFQTDFEGNLTAVINKVEIINKWEEIKKYQLGEYFAAAEMDELRETMDKDFEDPLPSLLFNWLYILFFHPVYGVELSAGNLSRQRSIYINANLLQRVKLPVQTRHMMRMPDQDSVVINQNATLPDHVNQDKNLRDVYKKQYAQLFGDDFLLRFNQEANYVLDHKTGYIKTCKAIITETLNSGLFYECKYHITQKPITT